MRSETFNTDCMKCVATLPDKAFEVAIVDTHLGSGSSRIAAYKLGFDFTGIEIDKRYFSMQEERFRNECILQQSLFNTEI